MVAVGDKNESILQFTARLNRAYEILEPMKLYIMQTETDKQLS